MKTRKYNGKRKIRTEVPVEERSVLSSRVKYVGSQFHKRYPGDYGLMPPLSPRPDASLCDGTGIEKEAAQALLVLGVTQGFISETKQGIYPKIIWAVSAEGLAFEAQLDNHEQGTYHGYPILSADPFLVKIRRDWEQKKSNA